MPTTNKGILSKLARHTANLSTSDKTAQWRLMILELESENILSTTIANKLLRHIVDASNGNKTTQYQHWFDNPRAWLQRVAKGYYDTELLTIRGFGVTSLYDFKAAAARAQQIPITAIRNHIYNAIDGERNRQTQTDGPPDRSIPAWLLLLEAQLNQAKHAYIVGDGDLATLPEILTIAATAVACIEQHGL